jgi:hypothetical protein
MSTILSMKKRFEAIDTDKVIEAAMTESLPDLNDLNLEQIYDGKTNTGDDIRPSYYEDPYFKTPEQAIAYSNWKDRITPNSRRNRGTPNLFINGYYYRSRSLSLAGDVIRFDSFWPEGSKIHQKYANINGLGGSYKSDFINHFLQPVLSKNIELATGLKMSK